MQTLLQFIRSHRQTCWEENGKIGAISHYTLNGVPGSEYVTIEPTTKAVREWLGY